MEGRQVMLPDMLVDKCVQLLINSDDIMLPFIYLYISAASIICSIAITADVISGFRSKKLWFPCKWFCLSSTSLTLLAVAMKLPMDLSSNLSYKSDWLAKLSGLTLMSTAMANFIPSLGSMCSRDILTNTVALGILSVTISADVLLRLELLDDPFIRLEEAVFTVFMLLSLLLLASSAVTIPSVKRGLQLKFRQMREAAQREDEEGEEDSLDAAAAIDEQIRKMMKYWVMAKTSSPQFVITRSVVSANASLISLMAVVSLIWTCIRRLHQQYWSDGAKMPAYGPMTTWILIIQSIGAAIGAIACTSRWLFVIALTCPTPIRWDFFKIDPYLIQAMVDIRDGFTGQHIRQGEATRKSLHAVKWSVLSFLIGVQVLTVFFSKVLVFASALCVYPFLLCYNSSKKVVILQSSDEEPSNNLGRYVLVLEGDAELPRKFLGNICKEGNDMIKKGKEKQPTNLIELLRKSIGFDGVLEFDDITRVPSLHSREPANSWALPVVTLAGIAITIANISEERRRQLIKSVDQGLSLAKVVESSTLNGNDELGNVRRAADFTWASIFLRRKWQGIDLRKTCLNSRKNGDVLEDLRATAMRTVVEFKKEGRDSAGENPLDWPCKVIAANSMYRISSTISLCWRGKSTLDDAQKLFDEMSAMIADIFAACFTNLMRAIAAKCCTEDVMGREKNVEEAFFLMGATEQIHRLAQQHNEWPFADDNPSEAAAYIDEWRALLVRKDDENRCDDVEETAL